MKKMKSIIKTIKWPVLDLKAFSETVVFLLINISWPCKAWVLGIGGKRTKICISSALIYFVHD